jgi:hypothetical protein
MPQKILQKSHISQLTEESNYTYPYHSHEIGDITFTSNFNTGYYGEITFIKIKGGGPKGGNYRCKEFGEEYRISKY